MREHNIGQIYSFPGELAIWPETSIYGLPPVGVTKPGDPILVLEWLTTSFCERWVHVLADGKVGWIKAHYVNLVCIGEESM